MLDINPDTVCFLIDKAREFHGKEQVVLPDAPDSPSEDWGLQALADHNIEFYGLRGTNLST